MSTYPIKYIEDENGNRVLPKTAVSAVVDEQGTPLNTLLAGVGIPDEEDLTKGNDGKVRFKDRPNTDGMGRVILRKNIVSGVNTLTQSMMTQTNTIYVIQYDFTLGEDITVPTDCVLEFDGGSIGGAYTINLNNCVIQANEELIIKEETLISGIIGNTNIYTSWFDENGTDVCIAKAIEIGFSGYLVDGSGNFYKIYGGRTIHLENKDYNIHNPIYVPLGFKICGHGAFLSTDFSGYCMNINIQSNTEDWVVEYSSERCYIEQLSIVGIERTNSYKGILVGGSCYLDSIYFSSLDVSIGTVNRYIDRKCFNNIFITKPKSTDTASVDIKGNGDGLILENFQLEDYAKLAISGQSYAANIRNFLGHGVISSVHSNIHIDSCQGITYSLNSSNVTLTNTYIRRETGKTGINISKGLYESVSVTTLINCSFVSISPLSIDNDITIENGCVLRCINSYATSLQDGTYNGVCHHFFINGTPVLLPTLSSFEYTNGKFVGVFSRNGGRIENPNFSAQSGEVDNPQEETSTLSTGTYNYVAIFMLDSNRNIQASTTTSTVSANVTGSNKAIKLRFAIKWSESSNNIIRLYRGTVSGQYNSYVDINVLCAPAATNLYDIGHKLLGVGNWNTLDNPVSVGTLGFPTSNSVVYDNDNLIKAVLSLKPTSGVWNSGDNIIVNNKPLWYNGTVWVDATGTPV